MLGGCSCVDGHKQPGCDAQESSTWAVWNGTHATAGNLPAGLSLTCSKSYTPNAAAPGDPNDGTPGMRGSNSTVGWSFTRVNVSPLYI
jgi:hypothetical protein